MYVQAGTHPALYRRAEALATHDEGQQRFRPEHLRITQRAIGPGVTGTGGILLVPVLEEAPSLPEQRHAVAGREHAIDRIHFGAGARRDSVVR